MKAEYLNLKVYDWNFDYARGKRLEIRGAVCSLPCEIADLYPNYFKKVTGKKEVVVTEVESENLVNRVKEEELVVVTEPKLDVESDELDLTLEQKFLKALADKEVKETKKNYEWNGAKFSKEAFDAAESKEEFLFDVMNK